MNMGMETRLKLASPPKKVSPRIVSEPAPSVRSSAATETAPSAKAIGTPMARSASNPRRTISPARIGSISVSDADIHAGVERRIIAGADERPQLGHVLQGEEADAQRQRQERDPERQRPDG